MKNDFSTSMTEKTSVKNDFSTSMTEKILSLLNKNNLLTISELSATLNVSKSTIERNLKKLQDSDKLRRIGPDKGGYWEVCS